MLKTIAKHEFVFTIKRKAYYLVTLGMPVIVLAYLGVVMLIMYASFSGELKKLDQAIGIVDESGVLVNKGGDLYGILPGEIYEVKLDLTQIRELQDDIPLPLEQLDMPVFLRRLRRFDDMEAAKKALIEGELQSVYRIPADYINTGHIERHLKERSLMGTVGGIDFLHSFLAENILRQEGVSEQIVERIQNRPAMTEFELDQQGQFAEVDLLSKGFSMGMPAGMGLLLVIALMMNSSLLLASVAEEKENKVMEVILSSVPADQLLFGKVLGLVAAGMLQIAIWMAMVSVIPILTMVITRQTINYDFHVWQISIGVLFVVLGFIFYGCLLAGVGSMGSTYKDCQQLTVAIILCACVPLMTMITFINDPNGIVAKVMSMIPLFSSLAMMLRLEIADSVPWWEVVASLAILLLSIWGGR